MDSQDPDQGNITLKLRTVHIKVKKIIPDLKTIQQCLFTDETLRHMRQSLKMTIDLVGTIFFLMKYILSPHRRTIHPLMETKVIIGLKMLKLFHEFMK